ncbi:hypothetical protein BCU68_01285 [Vibrio sp. 10N.286.49.B3]|uniref:GGDEF domain-containing protein n=1 Tax=Vibrio sp. 10N.286.49.B3 TaxID=1880855 RepID=UPI000C8174E0|nr:GGDEF domain-containing protein [Vibrio sp. 10N.286.49.B3]PMH46697.1 hypothetical protein BCU68_01285 [Vibrio sp. 10N.286.49.B3]
MSKRKTTKKLSNYIIGLYIIYSVIPASILLSILFLSKEHLGINDGKVELTSWQELIISSLPEIILIALILLLMAMLFSRKILQIVSTPFYEAKRYGYLICEGKLNTQSPSYRFDEFSQLFSSIDQLRDHLISSLDTIQKNELIYQKTYDLTQVCLFVIDTKNKKLIRANNEFESAFGDLHIVNNQQNRTKREAFIVKAMQGEFSHGGRFMIRLTNGWRYFKVNTAIVNEYQLECSALDITKLINAHKDTEKQMVTDPLTGINNRLAFNKHIAQIKGGNKSTPTIFMLDLNKFKPINDKYGHSAGDYLLQTVAKRITNTVKGKGVAYRLGGDEFIIITHKHYNKNETTQLISDLQRKINNDIVFNGIHLKVGASIGFCHYDKKKHKDIEETIHYADVSMYSAKRHRNSAVVEPATLNPES